MSYTYSNAFVRRTRDSVDWEAVDVSQVPLNLLLINYTDIYLVLTNPFESGPVYLTRAQLQQLLPPVIPSPTVAAWLAGLGSTALTTSATPPEQQTLTVGYTDAWQAGYVVQRGDLTRSPDTQTPALAQPDLLLTKAGVDLYAMSPYLIATVNGFLHPTVPSMQGLYIRQGGVSGALANNNHVGLLSFLNVGKVQQIPITLDMISKPDPSLEYRERAFITLPVSLTNKTVLLSLGGYLHVLDETYTVVGENTVRINMLRVPLLPRMFQSMQAINLRGLPLERSRFNANQLVVESVTNDATIRGYLTLPQSFVMVVDTPTMYRRTHQLERPTYPGCFFNQQGYRYPLVGSHGRLYDYRLSLEDGTYVYGCEPMESDNYLFETTDVVNQRSVSDGRQGYRRVQATQGTLLELGSYA